MRTSTGAVAQKLAELYEKPFGGKPSGRYRVSPKMLRKLSNRNKLSERYIEELAEELFELGFVLLNMESYYAIASVRTFASYRRLGEASLEDVEEGKSKTLQ